MSEYIVLQPVHLGKGREGEQRKLALEHIAAREGHLWGGEPSIGRWLVALAAREIREPKTFAMVSDKYGEPHLTTPQRFRAETQDVAIEWQTDGDHERYIDQDGDVILELVRV
jgi:hypothetical protein